MEGRQDSLEFWTQQQALEELKTQLLMSLSGLTPTVAEPLPERPTPPPATKSSFWGRKAKMSADKQEPAWRTGKPPASVNVMLDEVHFRSETEYGLYETQQGRCVRIDIEIR